MSELTIPIPEITESPKRFALSTDDRWWSENRALFRDPGTLLTAPILLDSDLPPSVVGSDAEPDTQASRTCCGARPGAGLGDVR